MAQSTAQEQTQQFQEETPQGKQPKRKRPPKPLLLIPLGLAIAGGLGTWYWLSRPVFKFAPLISALRNSCWERTRLPRDRD